MEDDHSTSVPPLEKKGDHLHRLSDYLHNIVHIVKFDIGAIVMK